MEATPVTKNQIIQQLTRSPHGELEQYIPVGSLAAKHEPEFLAHLIAWNQEHGAIRDSKLALPVCALAAPAVAPAFAENSLAHLAFQDPRQFVRGLEFARKVGLSGQGRRLRKLVERYLRSRERSFGLWERAVISHRASMKTLYARWHVKPGAEIFNDSLFKGKPPVGSALYTVSQLRNMSPSEALGHVLRLRIPFLVAVGALGPKLMDSDTVLALINSMSATELTTNAKMLERYGVKSNPALRAAFRAKLEAAVEATPKASLLKLGRAAAAAGDSSMAKTLASAQEKILTKAAANGPTGSWFGFVDKSGSMEVGIEAARHIAGYLGRLIQDQKLIFYDTQPRGLDVSGLSMEKIAELTEHVTAGGGTNASVCVEVLYANKFHADGVWMVTDCEDGHPASFVERWQRLCAQMGHEPTLYIFKVGAGRDTLTPVLEQANILTEIFDLRGGFDYYSLPNLLATMTSKRWGLVDAIMETPLKTLNEVFA